MEKKILDTKNFNDCILEISDIIAGAEGEIVVNLSGEVRSLLVPLATSAIFFNREIARVYNYEKIKREMKRIELPYVHYDLTDNEEKLLIKLAEEGSMFYNELTDELSLSKSTISRLSNMLEEKHLVQTDRIENQSRVSPTLTALLLAIGFENRQS